jgi:hypothetical protein
MKNSTCDRCSEVVADIDAGFSPGRQGMSHDCGGKWRVTSAAERIYRLGNLATGKILLSESSSGKESGEV